jgi:hypothetical protein
MGEDMRLCVFPEFNIDLDLLHSGLMSQTKTHVDWLANLNAGFDDHSADDRIGTFFQVHMQTGNCAMTEDAVAVSDDMRNTRIIEDRRLGSDHRQCPPEFIKLGHNYTIPRRT